MGLLGSRSTALAAAAALALGGAGCGPVGSIQERLPSGYEAQRQVPETFGYCSLGFIGHASFFGNIEDVEPGAGFTTTLPLSPGVVVAAVVVVASVAAAQGDSDVDLGELFEGLDDLGLGDRRLWVSGVHDPKGVIFAEYSMDLTLSMSTHEDLRYSGSLQYGALMVGARLAAPRKLSPRPYIAGGWGWYDFRYTAPERTDATVGGPYASFGLEAFGRREYHGGSALGVEFRAHFYFGEDRAGMIMDGGAAQLVVQASWYW